MGIDPGLRQTGYGLLDALDDGGARVVEAGVVASAEAMPLPARLLCLYLGVGSLLEAHRPCEIAVEDLYTHHRFPQTAVLMGHARGVILLAAAQAGCPVRSYSPAVVKKAVTGNGRAAKAQVQYMIQQLLGLSAPPEPDHVADALALAVCALRHGPCDGERQGGGAT
ncbi:MAG: crossover junction endodeoxyribonuclease RuvC [Clostridia bacterium]|nr:crossover junction endodeoxyribonuclease RuvC [Clostridia bacterium]